MNNPLQIVDNLPMQIMTPEAMQQQVNAIQKVMEQVMKKDTHYGVIPGTKEPSLFKAGAEKILATFRLSVDPHIEDLSTDDEIRYRVKVSLSAPDGTFVGAGVGECSTNEEKYKWHRCYIDAEYDATPESRRRIKYVQYRGKPVQEHKQIRTQIADQANTVLKMAKKRAMIDATLTATAASDIFTQDIEDMPEELRPQGEKKQGMSDNHKPAVSADAMPIVQKLENVAANGWDALREAWGNLPQEERDAVGADFGRIKKIAEEVNI